MSSKKISTSNIIAIGLMLFALYFGAGNLIFPAFLGQNAGDNLMITILGFLITGIGLPLLGFITLVLSGKEDVQELSSRVSPKFGLIFTLILYLAIGPFFAIPRAGTVPFEIAVRPLIGNGSETLALFIFSVIFFGITCFLALRPGKLIDVIGKVLTPIMLVLILIMVAVAFIKPMGGLQAAVGKYTAQPFFSGFKEGYLTLDTIASFAFGIFVLNAIREKGATNQKEMIKVSIKASVLSAVLLGLVYCSLAYMGATSVSVLGHVQNGAQVLAEVAHHYFGTVGGILLGAVVVLACLTTSIGLTSACAEYFHKVYSRFSIKTYVFLIIIFSLVISNIGLTNLIKVSMPVLLVIYPMVICLIFLVILDKFFQSRKQVYQYSLFFVFLIGLFDGLKEIKVPQVQGIQDFLSKYMPLYALGLGWVVPAIVGALVGYAVSLVMMGNKIDKTVSELDDEK